MADCFRDRDRYCPRGQCSDDGHCTIPSLDAGMADASVDGGGNVCARSPVTSKVIPSVVVIIDQSGSMGEPLSGANNRWDGLKAALLGTDPDDATMLGPDTGLIGSLEEQVRFGIYLYSSDGWESVSGVACPALTPFPEVGTSGLVSPRLANYDSILALYQPAEWLVDTPTGESIGAVLDRIEPTSLVGGSNPTIFILATDGAPDSCRCPNNGSFNNSSQCDNSIGPDPNPGEVPSDYSRRLSVEALQRAFGLGIESYVLAVADEGALPQAHVDDLANAGVGNPIGTVPAADSFRVTSVDQLKNDLLGIIQGQLSCTITLQGSLSDLGDACDTGTVRLVDDQASPTQTRALTCNMDCVGDPASCAGTNTWAPLNSTQIEIFGAACDDLLDPASDFKAVDASFPCDIIIVG